MPRTLLPFGKPPDSWQGKRRIGRWSGDSVGRARGTFKGTNAGSFWLLQCTWGPTHCLCSPSGNAESGKECLSLPPLLCCPFQMQQWLMSSFLRRNAPKVRLPKEIAPLLKPPILFYPKYTSQANGPPSQPAAVSGSMNPSSEQKPSPSELIDCWLLFRFHLYLIWRVQAEPLAGHCPYHFCSLPTPVRALSMYSEPSLFKGSAVTDVHICGC